MKREVDDSIRGEPWNDDWERLREIVLDVRDTMFS